MDTHTHARATAAPRDATVLRLGAAAGLVAIVLTLVMDRLHPGHAAPNDSAAVFPEYAASEIWVYVHIGQFLGTTLVVMSLLALARSLSRQYGAPGALALAGMVSALMVVVVFAVQMAVDGVVLWHAVRVWVDAAPGPAQDTAFQVAESVRSAEKGLSGFFHLSNGLTLLSLGLSVALGRLYARWLGWVSVAAGCLFLVGGVVTARTGFSPESSLVLTPGALLLVVFLVGACVSMWRRAAQDAPA